ncbi:hypothetical protein I7I48_03515 [Histoplasma ohiense]|nr:hypothetical protein I7I48_03515 [Histoplasma ohiense (nom. inval.)]
MKCWMLEWITANNPFWSLSYHIHRGKKKLLTRFTVLNTISAPAFRHLFASSWIFYFNACSGIPFGLPPLDWRLRFLGKRFNFESLRCPALVI